MTMTVPLRRLLRLHYGDALASSVREDGVFPVLGSGGRSGWHSKFNTVGPAVIVGRKGSFGSVSWESDDCFVIDTAYAAIPLDSSVHLRWLYYVLQSSDLRGVSQDVGVPGLPRDAAYAVQVPQVALEEQRRIAEFLDIETSRVDQLAAASYQQVELLRERTGAELCAVASELKGPDLSLLDPEAGWSAAGWSWLRLSKLLVKLTNGFVGPTRDILVDSPGVPYLQSLHVKRGRIDFERRQYFVDECWAAERPRIRLEVNDLVIVQTGAIGEVARIDERFAGASCHALLIARVNEKRVSSDYLYHLLRSDFGKNLLLREQTGALHPHLEAGKVRDILIPVPASKDQPVVVERCRAMEDDAVRLSSMVSRKAALLAERRQALITAAVTGQIDVSTARGVEV